MSDKVENPDHIEPSDRKYLHKPYRVFTDPYRWDNVHYRVFHSLGYPLDFVGEPGLMEIAMDSPFTQFKLDTLNQFIYETNPTVDKFVTWVGTGEAYKIYDLLAISPSKTPEERSLFNPDLTDFAKRCYLMAYERDREGKKQLEQKGHKLISAELPIMVLREKEEEKMYKQFISEGVKPITPQELREAIRKIAEEVLKEYPELRP